jgi:AcrR family transcriptional regulator
MPPAPTKKPAKASRSARSGGRAAPKASLRDEFRTYARAEILAAAEAVFAADGLHEARIEVIAERARVAVGTIYNLVGDREQLIAEVVGARQSDLVGRMQQVLEAQRARPFAEQLDAFLQVIFSYLREHRDFFRLVVEADHDKQGIRMRGRTLEAIRGVYRDLIDAGIAQRALRPKGRALYPVLLMGMVREMCFAEIEGGTAASPEKSAALVAELFLHGAGTR